MNNSEKITTKIWFEDPQNSIIMEVIRKKTIDMCEEDYLDDPITLFKIDTLIDNPLNTTCVKNKLLRPTESNLEEDQEFSVYGLKSSVTMPVRFFNISKNLNALGKCRPLSVKLANCKRIPFCKKILQKKKKTKKEKIIPGLNNFNNFILDLFDAKKAKKTSKTMHSTTTITNGRNLDIESKEKTGTTINYRENTGLLGMKISSEPTQESDRNIYSVAVNKAVGDKNILSNSLESIFQSKHNSKTLKEVKEKVSSLADPAKPCHSDEARNIILTKTEGSNSKTRRDSNEKQKISSKQKKTRKPRCDKGIKRPSPTDCSKDVVKNKLPNVQYDESKNQSFTDSEKKSLKLKAVSEHLVGKKIKVSASGTDHNEKIIKKYYTANKEYLIDNYNTKKNDTVIESELNLNNSKLNSTSKSVNGPKINKESKSCNKPKTNDEAKINIEKKSCNKTDCYNKDMSKLDTTRPGKDSSASLKCTDSNIRRSLSQKHDKDALSKKPVSIMKNNTIDKNNGIKVFNLSLSDDRMNTCSTPIINNINCNIPQLDDIMNTCPTPIINHINKTRKDFNTPQIDDIMNTCPTPIINHNSNYINKTQKDLGMPLTDDRMSTCPTPIINHNSNYIYNAHKDFNITQLENRINTCPTPIITNNTNYMNIGNNSQLMDDRMSTCPTPILASIPNNDIKVQTVDQINNGFNYKTEAKLITPSSTAEIPKTAANGADALLSINDIKKENCNDSLQIKQEIIEKEAQEPSHASKINRSNVNLVKPMLNVSKYDIIKTVEQSKPVKTIKTVDSQRDRGIYQRNFGVPHQNSLLIPLPRGPPPSFGPFDYPPHTNTNFNQEMMQYTMNSAPYNDIYSNLLGSDGYQQIPQSYNNNYPKEVQHLPTNLTLNNLNFHPNIGRNLPTNLPIISCNTKKSSNVSSNPPVPLILSQNLSDMRSINSMPQNMSGMSSNNNMPQNISNMPSNNNMPQNISGMPSNNNMPQNMSGMPSNNNMPQNMSNIPSNNNMPQNMSNIPSNNNMPQNISNVQLNNNMPQNMSNLPSINNMPQYMSNMRFNNNMPQNISIMPQNMPPPMSSDMSWYQLNANLHFGTPPNFIPPTQQQLHAQNKMMMHHNVTSFTPPPPPPPVTSNNKNVANNTTVRKVSTIPRPVTKKVNCNKTKTPLIEVPILPKPLLQTPYSSATTLNFKVAKLVDPVIRRYLTTKSQLTNKTPGDSNVPLSHGNIPTQNIISFTKDKFFALSKLVNSISKENNNKKETTVSKSNIRVEMSPTSGLTDVLKQTAMNPKKSKITVDDYNKRSSTDDQGIVDLCD